MRKRIKNKDRYAERAQTFWYRLMLISLYSLFLIPCSLGQTTDSIYMGTMVKLDIASPIVIPAANKWQIQNYEVAVNVRLAKRWYPTVEFGYAGGTKTQGDTITYRGQGGFFRVGCDLHPLKKHPESPHALLVGVRLGAAAQEVEQTNEGNFRTCLTGFKGDCWGEIVAGCQVEITKVNSTAFYMGWMGRFKVLFTRSPEDLLKPTPIYIPGFGTRNNLGWGLNYYLGWRF